MRVAVLGASGRTGLQVVEELLRRGYSVNGLTFKKPAIEKSNLNWIEGDATKEADLKRCLEGADAVISTLGHTKQTKTPIQTDSMKALVSALAGSKVKIVSMTGTGVRQPGDKPSLIDRVLNIGVSIMDPKRVSDGIDHAKVLQKSELDWKILRVLKLANGDQVEEVKLTSGGPAKMLINRATVAKLLVDLVETDAWYQKMPVAS